MVYHLRRNDAIMTNY